MPTYVSKGEEKSWEIHPSGLHQAVCCFVEDIGLQKTVYKGTEKVSRKVIVVWESEAKMNDGRPFMLSKRYTASLFDKAQLKQDLEAWRGRAFTKEELENFDVDTVIGANCFLNIVQEKVGDRTYANIKGIAPLRSGMEKMKAVNTECPAWIKELRSKAVTVGEAQASVSHAAADEADSLPF